MLIPQYCLRKRAFGTSARVLLIIGKALAAIVCAVVVLAGPVQLRAIQPFLMAVYAVLLPEAAADAVYSLMQRIRKKERRFVAAKTLSIILGVLFFLYGVLNMQIVSPRYHTYLSAKLKETHTVVMIADLHVGSAQSFRVTEKMVSDIKALQPDATILCGDIVDDYTTKDEMEKAFQLFSDFESPVYYVYGNHDRQRHAEYAGGRKFTEAELEKAITDSGATVLKDAFAEIAPDLMLLGREDLSEGEKRLPIDSLKNPNPEAYLIVADHQPAAFKDNLSVGTDLQLSGHTHAGQLFPLRAFYTLIGYCYGDYTEQNAVLNVSAGACGWRMPFRTDAGCHYEVIILSPEGRE